MKFNPAIKFLDYQERTLNWAEGKLVAYLGVDCGGGKTFLSLKLVEQCDTILIVCPAFLVAQWERNIAFCYPNDTEMFVVLPYSQLTEKNIKGVQTLFKYGVPAIIFDEAHYVKTPSAARTKTVFNDLVGTPFSRFIFLSATPITNTPLDLYAFLKKFNIDGLKKFNTHTKDLYVFRYCLGETKTIYIRGNYRKLIVPRGHSNMDEFKSLTKDLLYLVGSEEIEKNLPPLTHEMVLVDSRGVKKEFLKKEDTFRGFINNGGSPEELARSPGFTEYAEIRKLINVEKTKILLKELDSYLSVKSNTVIFCYHREVGEMLREHFETKYFINGSTSPARRDALQLEFSQEEKGAVFVGQIKSCGVGLDLLVNADRVIFMELDWNPLDLKQAFKRVHRGNQTRHVHCYYFALNNSIDIEMMNVIRNKVQFLGDFYGTN